MAEDHSPSGSGTVPVGDKRLPQRPPTLDVVAGFAQGHAFISYVHEDTARVDRLTELLETAGVDVWRDKRSLWPGEDWKTRIHQAITTHALAFIACFSRNSSGRERSYQNEELYVAVEELRLRPPDRPWLIPVRFDECDLPHFQIGPGRTLHSLQRVDLIGESWEPEIGKLIAAVLRILGSDSEEPRSRLVHSEPSSVAAAVHTTKRELSGADVPISAHDLLRREVDRVRGLSILRVDARAKGDDQIALVEEFLHEVGPLTAIVGTAAYWGSSATDRWWLRDIMVMARPSLPDGSLAVLDRPRMPALVLAWAAGTAAIAQGRYELVAHLFSLPGIDRATRRQMPAVLAVGPDVLHVSDELGHLYRRLRPIFVDHLALGVEIFADAFEEWQYLLALAAWGTRHRDGVFAPVATQGIRIEGSGDVVPFPERSIYDQLDQLGDDFPLLRAGLFDRSPQELRVAIEGLKAELAMLAEQADWRQLRSGSAGVLPSGLHFPGCYTHDADVRYRVEAG